MTRVWSAPESAKLGDIIAGADSLVDIETFGSAKTAPGGNRPRRTNPSGIPNMR